MNILVTGGAGFIGSHVVNTYVEEGHRVVVVDNLSTGSKKFLHPKAVFYQMDILDPRLSDILRDENIETINHHAAQISVSESVADPVFDAKCNIIGTLHLLKNAVAYRVDKFIFASTGGAIYGDQAPLPAKEELPCQPGSPYGISKWTVENYLRYYQDQYGLKSAILRYSNVYGPHQNPHGEAGVVAIFCDRLIHDQPPVIFGDGKQTRDYISVRDVARANALALAPEFSGIFNIGTEIETSVRALTEHLIRLSGKRMEAQFAEPRPYEQRRSSIACKKVYDSFGWKPKVPLEEGLSETFSYFNNHSG